jgi:hypothetical protein
MYSGVRFHSYSMSYSSVLLLNQPTLNTAYERSKAALPPTNCSASCHCPQATTTPRQMRTAGCTHVAWRRAIESPAASPPASLAPALAPRPQMALHEARSQVFVPRQERAQRSIFPSPAQRQPSRRAATHPPCCEPPHPHRAGHSRLPTLRYQSTPAGHVARQQSTSGNTESWQVALCWQVAQCSQSEERVPVRRMTPSSDAPPTGHRADQADWRWWASCGSALGSRTPWRPNCGTPAAGSLVSRVHCRGISARTPGRNRAGGLATKPLQAQAASSNPEPAGRRAHLLG